jgi:hypothetical protein
VKYWLVKFFTIDVQLHKDQHSINVKYRACMPLPIEYSLQLKNKNKMVNYILPTSIALSPLNPLKTGNRNYKLS